MDFISLPLYIKQKINFYAPFSCHMFLSRFHSAVKAIVGIMHIYNTAICIEVEFEKPNQASIYFKSAQLLPVPTHPKERQCWCCMHTVNSEKSVNLEHFKTASVCLTVGKKMKSYYKSIRCPDDYCELLALGWSNLNTPLLQNTIIMK